MLISEAILVVLVVMAFVAGIIWVAV